MQELHLGIIYLFTFSYSLPFSLELGLDYKCHRTNQSINKMVAKNTFLMITIFEFNSKDF